MNKTIDIKIVSVEEELFSGKAASIVIPAALGDMGIYPHHTPLLTKLRPGTLRLQQSHGEEELFYVPSGFVEVQPFCVIVLADTATRAADLDEAAATKAKERSERVLEENRGDPEQVKAAAQLAHAVAQLQTIAALRRLLRKRR